ncbi:dephospho-CoA kinase [Nitrosomonas sp.]|uniref:dephospho-CoA kinase n=1 Tax=Nitrosomonas sp. TaxID=42353 RepID=UPI002085B872|nr:dephospho-CoA kinase [Nitrosomonas sp.]GJL74091.1 MAG: dephospho-CoA kinase [Nitrosomonas sp.]
MVLTVGLTGGIGCGKSSAAEIFTELGIGVVDTDQIAHELTQLNGTAIASIRNLFGDAFITREGALDRKKMRQLIFTDNSQRAQLEALLHPLILEETVRRVQQSQSPYVVVAIPLLFETSGYDHLIQRILVIDCDEQLQITRTMARSRLSAEEVKAIMAAQINRQHRLKNADDIVVNNQDIGYLKEQILQLHQNYLILSSHNHPSN